MKLANSLTKAALISSLIAGLLACGVKGPPVNPDGSVWGPSSFRLLLPENRENHTPYGQEEIDMAGNPLLECTFYF